jgi:hypothetical protein
MPNGTIYATICDSFGDGLGSIYLSAVSSEVDLDSLKLSRG